MPYKMTRLYNCYEQRTVEIQAHHLHKQNEYIIGLFEDTVTNCIQLFKVRFGYLESSGTLPRYSSKHHKYPLTTHIFPSLSNLLINVSIIHYRV